MTRLYSVRVAKETVPFSAQDVAAALRYWDGKVAIGGGRYSMGGQIAIRDGLHLGMRGMDRVLSLDTTTPCVRVQAGMRWRNLQAYFDPHELSVETMQSYANFTVGGAVSVNAHGRYVGNGPAGNSVRALQLLLADGSVVEASRALMSGRAVVWRNYEASLDVAQHEPRIRAISTYVLQEYFIPVCHFVEYAREMAR